MSFALEIRILLVSFHCISKYTRYITLTKICLLKELTMQTITCYKHTHTYIYIYIYTLDQRFSDLYQFYDQHNTIMKKYHIFLFLPIILSQSLISGSPHEPQ